MFEEKRCIKFENTSKAKKSKYWVKFWQLMLVSFWVKGWKGLLPKICWWNSFFMVQELWCYTLTPLQDKKLFLAVLTHAGLTHSLPSFNLNYLFFSCSFFLLFLLLNPVNFLYFHHTPRGLWSRQCPWFRRLSRWNKQEQCTKEVSTNQDKQFFKFYLNDLKKYFMSYQGFKVHIVILECFLKVICIE